jgi:hypothetical protein
MSEAHDHPEMNALEASLGKLSPSPAALDRDQLMFQAGRASARLRWLWPAVAGTASLTAAALALVLVFRPVPVSVVEQRVVVIRQQAPPAVPAHPETPPEPWVETSAPVEDEPPLPQAEYLRRRQEVLRWGVDMLPPLAPGGPPPAPVLTPGAIRDYSDQPF